MYVLKLSLLVRKSEDKEERKNSHKNNSYRSIKLDANKTFLHKSDVPLAETFNGLTMDVPCYYSTLTSQSIITLYLSQ